MGLDMLRATLVQKAVWRYIFDVMRFSAGGPSMTPLDVFVTEHNIDIYLSKLQNALNPNDRDVFLRLLAKELANMGTSREHLENGERRVIDGRQRLERQRIIFTELSLQVGADHPAISLFETLERTQELLEEHLLFLRQRQEQTKP